jgi:hypothetical protein
MVTAAIRSWAPHPFLRPLGKQKREHEPHAPGWRAVRPHDVILTEDGDADRLAADFENLADPADDRHGPFSCGPIVGGLRRQVEGGLGRESVGREGLQVGCIDDWGAAGRDRDGRAVIAENRAASEGDRKKLWTVSPMPTGLPGMMCTTSVTGTMVRVMRFQSSLSLNGITG